MTATGSSRDAKKRGYFSWWFLAWTILVLVGTIFSGPVSSAYGVLTQGAIFAIVGVVTTLVSIIAVIFGRRDWRAWTSALACFIELLLIRAHVVHYVGP